MRKFSAILLIVSLTLSLIACGDISTTTRGGTPKNGIFNAPDEFYLEWDIPSVRDGSVEKEGYYNMPVYMIETYEELLHFKDIVGMNKIGSEINNTDYCKICYTDEPCSHDLYNEEFFENYTLLIGWHQYAGVILGEHVQKEELEDQKDSNTEDETEVDIEIEGTIPDGEIEDNESNAVDETEEAPPKDTSDESDDEVQDEILGEESEIPSNVSIAEYKILPNGSLQVYLQGEKSEVGAPQQWVLVAVPKNVMADCDSIAFFVKLPEEVEE